MFPSKEKPEMIQICYADGKLKCLIDSNRKGRGLTKAVLMANYQTSANPSPAQLWKFNSESGEIVNVEFSSCLVTVVPMKIKGVPSSIGIFSSAISIGTSPCKAKEVENEYAYRKWRFSPIVDKDRVQMCADSSISTENLVNNKTVKGTKFYLFAYNIEND